MATGYDIVSLALAFVPQEQIGSDDLLLQLINIAREQLEADILSYRPILLLAEYITENATESEYDLDSLGVTNNIQAVYWNDRELSYEPSVPYAVKQATTPVAYTLLGNKLRLLPAPTTSGELRIYYLTHLKKLNSLDEEITGDPVDLTLATAVFVAMAVTNDQAVLQKLTLLYTSALKNIEQRLKKPMVTNKQKAKSSLFVK